MIERHLMKLRARDEVSAQEEEAIRSNLRAVQQVPADHVMVRPNEELSHSTLLLDGIACRYKELREGGRQITELHVAGDFVDMHSFTLKRLDHYVTALTPCTIATIPHRALKTISEEFPHLTRLYWFGTNLDAAIHREWEVSLGRRAAKSRLAHLFCELHARLAIVGLADADTYELPLTQSDLADCMGLSTVHINRMLQELRSEDLLEWKGGTVSLLNLEKLHQVAEFDPSYLYMEKRAR
jgi:CRP-like cAMP-binding protein